MNITWTKTEYYEYTGQSEDHEHVLVVTQGNSGDYWYWKVYGGSGEYVILRSFYDDEDYFPDAEQAKQKATEALINYLKEKTTAI